jgi:hypothetical protein
MMTQPKDVLAVYTDGDEQVDMAHPLWMAMTQARMDADMAAMSGVPLQESLQTIPERMRYLFGDDIPAPLVTTSIAVAYARFSAMHGSSSATGANTGLYHPVEAAIIRIALGLEPEEGDDTQDLWNAHGQLPLGVVHLAVSEDRYYSGDGARAASDAVARLLLHEVQEDLPNFTIRRNGRLVQGRTPQEPRPASILSPAEFLFGINWATSGPGFDWPEHYYLGWLPIFDRWVVCGARDTSEFDGYCDRVVGHFPSCDDRIAQACRVIEDDWAGQRDCEQECWEGFRGAGLVSEDEAEGMAGRVWVTEVDEDEEDDGRDM